MIDPLRKGISTVATAWHEFWFAQGDPIIVSTLRLFVGGMVFYTLLVWGVDLESFFVRDGGWQSQELVQRLQRGEWSHSLWWLISDEYIWVFHVACLVIAAMFWAGLATTVTKWMTLAIIISYANRVPLANYGLDQLNVMLTLYLCLGPCGARLSLDRIIASSLNRRLRRSDRPLNQSVAAGFSVRMVQIHMCIIYFWAGVSKLQGSTWWTGEAVWRAASNYEYQQFSLTWLAEVPWLYQAATIGTWVWEISFAFLVWNRYCRLPVLLIGLSMHIGIGMFMGMWTFGLIMCFAYICFVPASALRGVLTRLQLIDTEQPDEGKPSCDESTATPASSGTGVIPVGSLLPAVTPAVESPVMARRRDDTVVVVESHLKNRAKISEMLKRADYACIAVDAWPEAVEIYNTIGARSVVCNASHQPINELLFWVDQLSNEQRQGRHWPQCVALIDPKKQPNAQSPDASLAMLPLPIGADDLSAILDGHMPMHLHDAQHSDALARNLPERAAPVATIVENTEP